MKHSRLTKALALLLAFVLTLSCCPQVTLHVHAEEQTAADKVNALQYFVKENLADYQAWLSELTEGSAEHTRLSQAIAVLDVEDGPNVYDDMRNVGTYQTGTDLSGLDKWDAFPTQGTAASAWSMVWGGLNGNQSTAYTLPGTFNSNQTLVVNPFNFTSITLDSKTTNHDHWRASMYTGRNYDMTFTEAYDWGLFVSGANPAVDYTQLLGGMNWATPSYVGSNSNINKIEGSGNLAASPAIIFDYKEPGYFSYLTILGRHGGNAYSYVTAVVVENYVAVREVAVLGLNVLDFGLNDYFENANTGIFDFSLVWDDQKECYQLTVDVSQKKMDTTNPGDSVQNGHGARSVYLKDGVEGQNFHLIGAKDAGDTSTAILSNSSAKKMGQFYVTSNLRARYLDAAPLTRLAIAYETACRHENTGTTYAPAADGSGHNALCANCNEVVTENLPHSYENNPPAAGEACTACGWVYGTLTEGEAKEKVNAVQVFKAEDMAMYQNWLTAMSDHTSAEYIRLNRAITKLSAQGVAFYDDLSNIGSYVTEGVPAGKWEAFPDADKTSQWNILWGGLSGTGEENYTLPAEHMAGHPTLKFKPFHFTAYSGMEQNVLLGGMNWATPSYIGTGKYIDAINGTVIIPNLPTVIFDYKAPGYYSYITVVVDSDPFYVAAVVVEDYVAVRQVKLHQLGDSAGQMNDNWMNPSNGLGIFSMAWDAAEGCYRLKIDLQSPRASSAYPGTDGVYTSFNNNPNLHFNVLLKNSASFVAVSGTDTNILSNAQPAKLEQLYVSTDYRATAQGSTPFTNFSISTVEGCEHTAADRVADGANLKAPGDCETEAVYWDVCSKCGRNLGTTWQGEKGEHAYAYTDITATHHRGICSVCGDNTGSVEHTHTNYVCACGHRSDTAVDSAESAAQAVDDTQYFLGEKLDLYEFWMDYLTDSTYTDQIARLERAIGKLEAGADYYDDLSNIGSYETSGHPDHPWDAYQEANTTTSQWDIRWGGLVGDQVNNYTLPKAFIEDHPTLNFHAFDFSIYPYGDFPSNQEDWTAALTEGDWGYLYDGLNRPYDFTGLLGGMNWATPSYAYSEDEAIDSISGTLVMNSAPAIIFDYKAPGYYSYLTVYCKDGRNQQSYLTAVVVKDYKAVREVKLHRLYDGGNGYLWLTDHPTTSLANFTLEWDNTYNCYKFTMKSGQTGNNSQATATPGSSADLEGVQWNNLKMDPVIYLSDDPNVPNNTNNGDGVFSLLGSSDSKDASISILSNEVPTKLQRVYITTSPRNLNLLDMDTDSFPAITQLAITTSQGCAHEPHQNSDMEFRKQNATCQEGAVYWHECSKCHVALESTWQDDTRVAHKYEYEIEGDTHRQVCSVCAQPHPDGYVSHEYSQHSCACGRRDDTTAHTPEAAAAEVDKLQHFKAVDLGLYEYWLVELVKESETYADQYQRLKRAIDMFKADPTLDVFDDLANVGSYAPSAGTGDMEKWDAFQDPNKTSDWSILWGGLTGDRDQLHKVPSDYNMSYTDSGTKEYHEIVFSTLALTPYHYQDFVISSPDGTKTLNAYDSDWRNTLNPTILNYDSNAHAYAYAEGYEWGYMYRNNDASDMYDFTGLLGGVDWATPDYVESNQGITRITGSAPLSTQPNIIFDYQSPGNFSYLTFFASSGGGTKCAYLTAIVVENYKAVREVKLAQIMPETFAVYSLLANPEYVWKSIFDFDLVWDTEQKCYKFTMVLNNNIDGNGSVAPGSQVEYAYPHEAGFGVFELYLKDDYGEQNFTRLGGNNSNSIFANGKTNATQLTDVYVSANPRATTKEQALLTRLAVSYDNYDYRPEILGGKLLDGVHNVDQNLRIDVDFSNIIYAAGQGIDIKYFGVAVKAQKGNLTTEEYILQLKAIAENENATADAGRFIHAYTPGKTPGVLTVVNQITPADYGKRMMLVAFLVDEYGNYYYSENSLSPYTATNLGGALDQGMISTGVMRIMKAILADQSVQDGYYQYIEKASEYYWARTDINADVLTLCGEGEEGRAMAIQILKNYLGLGDEIIGTTHEHYDEAKEIARWVFAYCDQARKYNQKLANNNNNEEVLS